MPEGTGGEIMNAWRERGQKHLDEQRSRYEEALSRLDAEWERREDQGVETSQLALIFGTELVSYIPESSSEGSNQTKARKELQEALRSKDPVKFRQVAHNIVETAFTT